jgi:CheY-like chemotaxis protein
MDTDTTPLAIVIEDNEDLNMIFATALQQAGYQTESIFDGLVAKQRLTEFVPDLVVLDLHIPGANGNIILGQIRNDPRLVGIRVILATADAEFASNLQSEADLVLLKPISFSQLSLLANRLKNTKHTLK